MYIKRTRRVWGQFRKLLEKEEVPPRVAFFFLPGSGRVGVAFWKRDLGVAPLCLQSLGGVPRGGRAPLNRDDAERREGGVDLSTHRRCTGGGAPPTNPVLHSEAPPHDSPNHRGPLDLGGVQGDGEAARHPTTPLLVGSEV